MSPLTDEEVVAALADSPWERLQAAQPSPASIRVDALHPPRWRVVFDRAIACLELLVWLLETEMGSFDEEIDGGSRARAIPARLTTPARRAGSPRRSRRARRRRGGTR